MRSLRKGLIRWPLIAVFLLCSGAFAESEPAAGEPAVETKAIEAESLDESAIAVEKTSAEETVVDPDAVAEKMNDTAEAEPQTKAKSNSDFVSRKPKTVLAPGEKASVYVVPIHDAISDPQLYILRRALKEAIELGVEVVVIDMDTPGGELGVTLEMMEALAHFKGETITFVNDEAISAGSYIAVATGDIFFSPSGVMGAAEAVTSSGDDINESMQRKIESYLKARVRSMTKGYPYRADVQRKMMDPNFVLTVEGEEIEGKDSLLSLTAEEAVQKYGDPAMPLLAEGIAEDVDDLLTQKFGAGNYEIKRFEVSWSENFAKWFNTIAPGLFSLGVILLVIEFKTPSFGIIGGLGIALILTIFASNYFAGLAGHEEVIVFAVGVALIAVEMFLLPGTLVIGFAGVTMILGSLVWAMADIWPTEDFSISPSLFYGPAQSVGIGLLIAFFGLLLVARFLPKTSLWQHMVLSTAVGDESASEVTTADSKEEPTLPPIGTEGIAVTDMYPSGQVEIAGSRYEAAAVHGALQRGDDIEVASYRHGSLMVQKAERGGAA